MVVAHSSSSSSSGSEENRYVSLASSMHFAGRFATIGWEFFVVKGSDSNTGVIGVYAIASF